ncbi:RNase H-like domain-containing protein, partial [Nocardia mangyaensis]|uniref:RNase H-like domain-containing protein n=1 Tax=Nocardia mangyaensis TaxID=2213200 RepID=UPI0034604AB4
MLAFLDFSKPFEVISDALGDGLGAILVHEGRPIAFESRKYLPAERNYPVIK